MARTSIVRGQQAGTGKVGGMPVGVRASVGAATACRAAGIVLAASVLCCAALLGACGHPQPAHAEVNSIRVDGKVIYSSDAEADVEKAAGFSYKPASKTLTLKDVKLVSKAKQLIRINAQSSDTVKVKLKGSNSLTAKRAGACGIQATCHLKLDGTQLSMTDMGTAVTAAEVVINNGTYAFKKCTKAGVLAVGAVKIPAGKAGTVSITTAKPQTLTAISGSLGKVSCSPDRLGTIAGALGTGAVFYHANNTYEVTGPDKVKLVQYMGGKEANLESVTFGRHGYDVVQIAPQAFDNRVGHKVTKVVVGSKTRIIGRDAFKGTGLLTNLNLKSLLNAVDVREWRSILRAVTSGIDSKAFRACGMLSGAKMTVHTGFSNDDVNVGIKAALTLKGLPLLAKVRK